MARRPRRNQVGRWQRGNRAPAMRPVGKAAPVFQSLAGRNRSWTVGSRGSPRMGRRARTSVLLDTVGSLRDAASRWDRPMGRRHVAGRAALVRAQSREKNMALCSRLQPQGFSAGPSHSGGSCLRHPDQQDEGATASCSPCRAGAYTIAFRYLVGRLGSQVPARSCHSSTQTEQLACDSAKPCCDTAVTTCKHNGNRTDTHRRGCGF